MALQTRGELRIKGILTTENLVAAFNRIFPEHLTNEDIHFVCIGTDRSTGDAFGPMIGTYLSQQGYTNLVGTLNDPVHGMNLDKARDDLPKDKVIIAIDASLGHSSYIGTLSAAVGPMRPGSGVKKDLGEIGDYHVNGVVNVGGYMEFFVLQNTRLALVMNLANKVLEAIMLRFPLQQTPH